MHAFKVLSSFIRSTRLLATGFASLLKIPGANSLSKDYLRSLGVRVLVLDFDGVLASHGCSKLDPAMEAWFKSLDQEFLIYIWTNNPNPERIDFLNSYYQHLNFRILRHCPKKPDPKGLLSLSEDLAIEKSRILIVDDRLSTGVLAGLLAKTQVAWVFKPLQDFHYNPLQELFFSIIRCVEKTYIQIGAIICRL
ncbi:MAG: hypothetical protein ACKOAD_01780 [Gammaproteobacteria bacterium]